MGLWIVVVTVATAVVFDFTNGFHDTANAMATTIATRALPRAAVGLAACLNFVGAFISVTVAATIASGIVDQAEVTVPIIFAGLVGAILWNVATTQTVSGGIMGAGLGRAGGVVHWLVVRRMVVAWLLTMPAAGAVGALSEEVVAAFANASVGVTVVAAVGAVLLLATFRQARLHGNVDSRNVIEPEAPRVEARPVPAT